MRRYGSQAAYLPITVLPSWQLHMQTCASMSCLQWCGHCKHLVPVLSSLGKSIQGDPKLKNRVAIAKVGCLSPA